VPGVDLADRLCPSGISSDSCFTEEQIQTVSDFYTAPYDSNSTVIYPGKMFGSEPDWANMFIPHAGNSMMPSMLRGAAGDHVNYLFYEKDPGVTISVLNDINYQPRATGSNPEYYWMDFSVDDFTADDAELMSSIMDATDPDLNSFLKNNDVYHGLTDALSVSAATVNYFSDMVNTTFNGSFSQAAGNARLFLAPGMSHCGGGAGPNSRDKPPTMVDWVENGIAPDSIIATHHSNGAVDNERPLCPSPNKRNILVLQGENMIRRIDEHPISLASSN